MDYLFILHETVSVKRLRNLWIRDAYIFVSSHLHRIPKNVSGTGGWWLFLFTWKKREMWDSPLQMDIAWLILFICMRNSIWPFACIPYLYISYHDLFYANDISLEIIHTWLSPLSDHNYMLYCCCCCFCWSGRVTFSMFFIAMTKEHYYMTGRLWRSFWTGDIFSKCATWIVTIKDNVTRKCLFVNVLQDLLHPSKEEETDRLRQKRGEKNLCEFMHAQISFF